MKDLIKTYESKYKGLRYSNLIRNRKNEWWFTISSTQFVNKVLYLMLIHGLYKEAYVLRIDTTQLLNVIPRKKGVHLAGQYDLYFTLDENQSLVMKYLTLEGHKIENVSNNIIEHLKSDFIRSIEDLKDNLLKLETYLDYEYSTIEKDFALSLVQKGKNFIAYKIRNEIHFAPSRFVGYKNNSMDKHLGNTEKDGRETTPVINAICKEKLQQNIDLDEFYIQYCNSLGLKIHNQKRQYWLFDFTGTQFESLIKSQEYKEGRILDVKHRRRERNRKLVEDAKLKFRLENNNQLFCQICNFNFMDIYGIDYIEIHHLNAISEMDEETTTSLDDVCLVCPNCHRIIHSKYPYYTIEEVKEMINRRT